MTAITQADPIASPAQVQPLAPPMRLWLVLDTLLVAIAGVQLYVFAGRTEHLFAWTIAPPLTAAFLGAAYFASIPLVFLSSRARYWAQARVAVFGVLAFTTLTTAVTLLHLERFHLESPLLAARVAAWAWVVVYLAVPPALSLLLIWQSTRPGFDPPRQAPLPAWARVLLALQAGLLLLLGLLLLAAPTAPVWPWPLTPLTGRAVAAWLVGIGIILAHVAIEACLTRVRPALIGLILFVVLQLGAVLRYAGTFRWLSVPGVLYLGFLVGLAAVLAAGWVSARRRL
jgi:hypothetical protein